MYLIIRESDNVIIGTIEYMKNITIEEVEANYDGHYIIEIPDEEYQQEMIGAIYNG